MATDMGKLPKRKNIIWPIIWKEMHQEEFQRDPQSFLARSWFSQSHARTWSRWRSLYQMDDLAEQDFSHYMTESEYFRYKQNWWISVNKSGNTGPLRNRSDFNQALSTLNFLYREAGGKQLRPTPYWKYQERHPSSSSSSSWWQWSGSWWSS